MTLMVRVIFAVLLVLLTYNPTRWSYVGWVASDPGGVDAVKAFLGVLLLAGWLVCLRSAWVSLGTLGVVLTAALLGTFIWLLLDVGVLANKPDVLQWAILIAVGVLLGFGLSWSLLRQKATGQVEVD